MKNLFILTFSTIILFSCQKDAAPTNGGSTANGANTFTWVDNSITYNCDSAFASTQFKTIFVYKGATTNKYFFEINLTGLAVANYPFTTTGNALAYIRPATSGLLTAFAGSLAISANANNKISGAGVTTINSGGLGERINFTFTDLPVR